MTVTWNSESLFTAFCELDEDLLLETGDDGSTLAYTPSAREDAAPAKEDGAAGVLVDFVGSSRRWVSEQASGLGKWMGPAAAPRCCWMPCTAA